MEIGALDHLSGGRAILGLGASAKQWVERQLGVPYARPPGRLEFVGRNVCQPGRILATPEFKVDDGHRTELTAWAIFMTGLPYRAYSEILHCVKTGDSRFCITCSLADRRNLRRRKRTGGPRRLTILASGIRPDALFVHQ
jgi:hypothetical protein